MRNLLPCLYGAALSNTYITAAILASGREKRCVVLADRPEPPDSTGMLLELACKRPKYEFPKHVVEELGFKKSAYERRNPNRPFYTRFQKKRRSK